MYISPMMLKLNMFFDKLTDLVLAEARKVTVLESSSGEDDQEESPPAKTPHLFSGYQKKSTKKSVDHGSSVQAEIILYIQVASDEDEVDCLEFWKRQSKTECLLSRLPVHQWRGCSAMKGLSCVLTVPGLRQRHLYIYMHSLIRLKP